MLSLSQGCYQTQTQTQSQLLKQLQKLKLSQKQTLEWLQKMVQAGCPDLCYLYKQIDALKNSMSVDLIVSVLSTCHECGAHNDPVGRRQSSTCYNCGHDRLLQLYDYDRQLTRESKKRKELKQTQILMPSFEDAPPKRRKKKAAEDSKPVFRVKTKMFKVPYVCPECGHRGEFKTLLRVGADAVVCDHCNTFIDEEWENAV